MAVLNSTAEFWKEIDNEAYDTDLLMAIEFSDRDRVSLFIAVCDVDRVQAEIINKYTEQLKPDFKAYQIAVNSNNLNPVRSIAELVDREPYLQAGGKAVISVVGATALASVKLDPNADKPDRDTFFGYLQWTRESFRNFHLPIVFWVSKNIYNLMLSETPDFWSWRNGVFFFKADPKKVIKESMEEIDPSNSHNLDLDLAASNSIPLPDLVQLIERTVTRNPEDPLLVSLYNQVANLYIDRLQTGRSDDYLSEQNLAIKYLQKVIDLATESSTEFATGINELGDLYYAQGRYTEAEALYIKSLVISEKQLGTNHPDTATSLNNLAGLYYSVGRYAEAEPLYLRSLAINEEQLGINHPITATIINNLAGLYCLTGRYVEAEPLYLRSLAISEEQLGANHPDTASSLNNLAGLYYSIGRYAEAEPLYLRSLAINEQELGVNHPNTAASLNNLASLYESIGRYIEAEPLLVRSLAIREEQLGANHPSTATSLNNLASLYESIGRDKEAEILYLRSLAIREEQLGANHPSTATSLNNLASLYESIGRDKEAEILCLRALEILESALGNDHPNTQNTRNNLQILRKKL
jgi:tetratricopeptide (TPR) repeat protein